LTGSTKTTKARTLESLPRLFLLLLMDTGSAGLRKTGKLIFVATVLYHVKTK
jgi:hypothetical protein